MPETTITDDFVQVILGKNNNDNDFDDDTRQSSVTTRTDRFFLLAQSDYVRAKFRFDKDNEKEEPDSIHFPDVDLDTWNLAMTYLEPATWAAKEPVDCHSLKRIVPFYTQYCFTKGIAACDAAILTTLIHALDWKRHHYSLAATAIQYHLPSAEKVKQMIKEDFGELKMRCVCPHDMAVLFSCYELSGNDNDNNDNDIINDDEMFLRESAAHVLCAGFQNRKRNDKVQKRQALFGIRVQALKNWDIDEIAHYLRADDISTILSDAFMLQCWCDSGQAWSSHKRHRMSWSFYIV